MLSFLLASVRATSSRPCIRRPLPLPVVAILVSMSRERLLAAIAAGRLRATEVSGQLMVTPANLARFLTDLSRDLSTRPDLDTRALPHIARQGFGS